MTGRGSAWGSLAGKFPGGQMADVVSRSNGHSHSPQAVELRVAASLENLAVLRTLVAAVGTFEDLDFDAVADLRLASTTCESSDILAPGSFSWHVLTSLTDEVNTFTNGSSPDGQVFGISMMTRRASSLQ